MKITKEQILSIEDPTKRFEMAVEYCKPKVEQVKDIKYEVAEIAVKVCDIYHGGRKKLTSLTLTDFAREIQMSQSTLARWVREYEIVISKLTKKQKEKGVSRAVLEIMLKENDKHTPASVIRKTYDEKHNISEEDMYCLHLMRRLKSVHFGVCHNLNLGKVDRDFLDQVKELVDEMYFKLNSKYQDPDKIKKTKLKKAMSVIQ